jgi:hypothetical protein
MSLVSGKISDEGPLIDILVNVAPARKKTLERVGFPVPPPQYVRAVIDTGASISGVAPDVLLALGLDGPIDVVDLYTPSTRDHPDPGPVYLVDLTLARAGGESMRFENLRVLAAPFRPDEEAKALLGRDVLRKCHFQYFGPEQWFQLGW